MVLTPKQERLTPREKRTAYMDKVGYTKLSASEREGKLIEAIRYMQKVFS